MKFKLYVEPSMDEELILRIKSECEFSDRIEELVCAYNGEGSVVGITHDEIGIIAFSDIECFTVVERKTFDVTTDGGRYRLNKTLSSLEEILPSDFIRINKSAIANKKHIKCFKTLFSGAVDAVFKSGFREYVSRRCFAEIKRRFKNVK